MFKLRSLWKNLTERRITSYIEYVDGRYRATVTHVKGLKEWCGQGTFDDLSTARAFEKMHMNRLKGV